MSRERVPKGPRPVSRPQDADERQAERAADVVTRGGSVSGWSFASVTPAVQRQETGKPKSDDEKKKEALEKAGEAALETPTGKAVKEKVLNDPVVKGIKDAASTPAGMVATGVGVVGGAAALREAHKPLPFQPPAIPLDRITPGLSAQVKVEGPLNAPTFVGLTISYKEQGPKGKKTSEHDRIAADIARLKAEQQMFQPKDDKEAVDALLKQPGLPGLRVPLKGTPKDEDAPKKDEEAAPVQRAPAAPTAGGPSHANVDGALAGGGRPLESATRQSMESRFGRDFSRVRIHDDARASEAARSLDAAAFTSGQDVAFAPGRYEPSTPEGRRLLAHELAHVVQQSASGKRVVQRQPAATPPATTTTSKDAGRKDYEDFVDTAVQYLEGARDHWHAVAQAAHASPPGPPGKPKTTGVKTREAKPGATPAARPAAAPQPPGLSPERLHTVLEGLLKTYEGARETVEKQLGGDAARTEKLRVAYLGAATAARSAAASTGRTNLVLIAAPKAAKGDWFIANATRYAQLYFSKAGAGDTLVTKTKIASPDELFDAVESTEPDKMMRRVDIFCHGTIEPTHQIRFGAKWFNLDEIKAAAEKRATRGTTLQNQSRFDGSTVIEFHACRVGAAFGDPGRSGMPVSTGEGFLQGVGAAVGGERGQEVVGYAQRWVPRRFQIGGLTSLKGLRGKMRTAVDRILAQYFDALAGTLELNEQLTEAERAGAAVSQARKLEIMHALYEAGGGLLVGHQYSTATPQSQDPTKDVPGARDTFTNEANWSHLVLRTRVPAAAGATP